ncbi:hypothetical protein MRX96_051311, partial [Rhipicephalus microplus]
QINCTKLLCSQIASTKLLPQSTTRFCPRGGHSRSRSCI